LRALAIAEDELGAGVAEDEMHGRTGKLETDGHRDEAGTHDPVIGREIFGGIGGEDGDALATRESTPAQRAGHPVRHGVKASVTHLARDRAAEIDDCHLVEILVAGDKVAKVGEARHRPHAPFGGAVR
jgi:hypothetical protein